MLHQRAWILAKVAIACAAITALASVPAHRLAPGLSFLELLVLLGGAFVALLLVSVASLAIAQLVLRAGGTDPQWFWFDGEPRGLQGLREHARKAARRES